MIDEIDYTKLNNMTSFLKQESESTAEFTIEFIECLMNRYNLDSALFEGIEIEEVPEEILNTLREGNIPTKEDLLPLNSEAQNILLMELIWFCGVQRIALFSEDEELEEGMPSTFDSVLAMRDVSNAHIIGSYLISALTLLMSKIPSPEMMDLLTNNFEDSQQNMQRISTIFLEVCSSILCRYNEDSYYYTLNDEDE
jgi:hypothetical protein